MGLFTPLFLLGALAIALPLWLHRLQTQDSTRQPFASTMLLEPAERRTHLHRTLKYRWLLLLRVLLLALLALAFARPFLERSNGPGADPRTQTHLVVLDTSLSMSGQALFDKALTRAREVIDSVPAGDAVLVLDSTRLTVQRPGGGTATAIASTDRAEALAQLSRLRAGASRLDFGRLMRALGRRAEAIDSPVLVTLVSDLQASGMPNRFADLVPDGGFELSLAQVTPDTRGNWSIEYVRERDDRLAVGVRAHQIEPGAVELELRINEAARQLERARIASAGEIEFEAVDFEQGENRVEVRLQGADAVAGDNLFFHVLDRRAPSVVPVLTRHADELALTYLRAALQAAGGAYSVEPLIVGEFDPRVLSRHHWMIVTDLADIDRQSAEVLAGFLADGGNLLAFASDPRGGLSVLPVTGNPLAPARAALDGGPFTALARIDATHPVLRASQGWERVNLAHYIGLTPNRGDRVLIELETGEPLLIESRLGRGRMLLLATGLDNRSSDLPTRAVFVSFMVEAASSLSGGARLQPQYMLGDALALVNRDAGTTQVVDPTGARMLALGETRREQRISLDIPGFYEVYTAQGQSLVAANVDPRESDLTPMSPAAIRQWQQMLAGATAGDAALSPTVAEGERERKPLWPWLLAGLCVLVIVESLTANHYMAARTGTV